MIYFKVINGSSITVCNVYGPYNATERPYLFQNYVTFISTHKHNTSGLILCKDKNIYYLDTTKLTKKNQRSMYTVELNLLLWNNS